MPRAKACRDCGTEYSMGVQNYDPPKCPSCGSGEWRYADAHRRRSGDYERSKKPHGCNRLDGMGNGCRDSWWTGGNWGVAMCYNMAHHDREPEKPALPSGEDVEAALMAFDDA